MDHDKVAFNVYDHGLLYGDGVFEGIRVYNGNIFMVQAHIDRLFAGARAIRLKIPMSRQEILDAMTSALDANGLTDGYLRLVVTRGAGNLGLHPFQCGNPRVFIIADKIALYPKEMYELGMSVIVASTTRNNINSLSPRIKSLNYLNNILAKIEAIDAGVSEAIMLNAVGMVAEATGDNVFLVRDDILLTPPANAGILEGITRGVVMELARKASIGVRETDLSRYDLYSAAECFLTGTAAEIIAVTQIDGRAVGDGAPGPITKKLQKAFHELVRRRQQ
ncbi:MAG: branched-chain-amino-acid transaminase [Planctomycetes bacterium]|nr:branched-chain-amino-acid transaminase [Planctomycetota bacterium]